MYYVKKNTVVKFTIIFYLLKKKKNLCHINSNVPHASYKQLKSRGSCSEQSSFSVLWCVCVAAFKTVPVWRHRWLPRHRTQTHLGRQSHQEPRPEPWQTRQGSSCLCPPPPSWPLCRIEKKDQVIPFCNTLEPDTYWQYLLMQ